MRTRRMIERLEQRRLLSCCGAGMAAMAHGAASHAQMAAQLAEHYGHGQQGQHVAQASGHGMKSMTAQNHMGNAGHKTASHANHAALGHDHQTMPMDEPVGLYKGTLMVHGTPEDDTVKISPNADDPTRLDVTLNGEAQSFRRADVKQIHVMTGKGRDTVEIDPSLDIPSIVNGRQVQ